MSRVENTVALVTGAARGQGRSHAVRLAEEGADIIAIDLCGQIDTVPYGMSGPDDLAETVRLVEALGRRISTHQVDVRDLEQMKSAAQAGISVIGPVDIVVANAGIFSHAPTREMTAQMWQDMIDVNLTGVWNTVRAVAPSMLDRGTGGSIILISSSAGIKGFPAFAHYTAAKHGVVGLMKSFAAEFGQDRIRVNSIHPSSVDTPMIKNEDMYRLFCPDLENPTADDYGNLFQSMHMLPVKWADPRDISNAVLWLASDDSRYVTGLQVKIDLGFCEL